MKKTKILIVRVQGGDHTGKDLQAAIDKALEPYPEGWSIRSAETCGTGDRSSIEWTTTIILDKD